MPQVDLEALVSVCAGSCDNKIACETLAVTSEPPHTAETDETPPDFPPESFCLSKDAEIDWFDRNAFYERKDSTKGASNNSTNLNPNINSNTTSNSQRFTNLKHKASIIGLPKPQKTCFADAKARRCTKPGNTHLFPKRSSWTNKQSGSIIEPSSPKVSCMGRVRSKRDRRRLRQKQRSTRSMESETSSKPERSKKPGLLASFKSIFRHGSKSNSNRNNSKHGEKNDKSFGKSKTKKKSSKENNHDILDRLPASERDAPRKSLEGVGLGGMNRFASGRRGDILGADVA